jgi:hypothetical protein
MSSSTRFKELILSYGFNEIKNDLEWLKESDSEIKNQWDVYQRSKRLSGTKIGGKELTYEEHLNYTVSQTLVGEYVVDSIENIENISLLKDNISDLEMAKSNINYLINVIEDRISELEYEEDEEDDNSDENIFI